MGNGDSHGLKDLIDIDKVVRRRKLLPRVLKEETGLTVNKPDRGPK